MQLLAGGPKCRQELAELTPYKINGVCSIVDALEKKGAIERTGDYDVQIFNGTVRKRERFRVVRRGNG